MAARVKPPRDVVESHGDWTDELYVTALRRVYEIAYAKRRGELTGRFAKARDEMGLEPFSVWCGRAFCLELLMDIPPLWSPHEMRQAAAEDALEDFTEKLLEAKP